MSSSHMHIAQESKMEDEEASQEEILAAIAEATSGASLLKLSRKASYHFRQFNLTMDLSRLIWNSPRKEEPGVMINEITEIVYGQTTPVFKKNPNPQLETLSFSLLYSSNRTLDLICKDRREFKVWTTAMKALINGFRDADAVSKYISSQGMKAKPSDRVAVVVGTLTAKVQVKENASDLYTWGIGHYGLLGHGESDKETQPRVVEALLGKDIVNFALGSKHMMAVSANGAVFSWGSGQYGRLGQGHLRDRYAPLMISEPLRGVKVTQIACHEFHSAVVSETGDLYTWGKAGPHLGYKLADTKQLRPRKVDAMVYGEVIAVACGMQHTVVIASDRNVYAFGQNDRGQLGLGNREPTDIPMSVTGLKDLVPMKVACGRFHTALHTADCQVATWGANDKGQLGLADTTDRDVPTLVTFSGEHLIADVSCGDSHTVALTANSIVFSWGDNEFQQLGLNKQKKSFSSPVAVVTPAACQIRSVACGGTFTAALSSSDIIYTWGCNSNGQLGHGDYRQRFAPTVVDSLQGKHPRSIQCGGQHMACSIRHTWVPDEEAKGCMACKKQFTTFYRRHHCRQCGGVFCGNCSTKRFPLLHLGMSEPVRVCDRCHNVLSADNS